MYEPAAPREAALGPVWHVAGPHTFFAGPLRYNAAHQHGAPVFLAGLYGSFRIRVQGQDWVRCRTALVPAGVLHELDVGGAPLGVLYLEPGATGPDALVPLLSGTTESGGALLGAGGEIGPLRALWEAQDAPLWAGESLADLTAFSGRRGAGARDERILRVVARLTARPDPDQSAARLARMVGLSESRLQHLFTREVGVPFRRYRAWARMRRAIEAVVAGANFTGAAHAAGFADQAHFAHDFRRTFGAPASGSLLDIRR
ncbi:AraC family transcriptional regulator [Methylobacterium radiodurans]|uniref:AraC family transcriptional regulator n=1 Tax=Methylobacterium radiodurans TaxID=2202828 RepID=UPI001FE9D372|nr:AraC family transcriptional regulator [Methylobacterium radiodurans]